MLKTFILNTQRPAHSGGESLVKYNTLKLIRKATTNKGFWASKHKQKNSWLSFVLCIPLLNATNR